MRFSPVALAPFVLGVVMMRPTLAVDSTDPNDVSNVEEGMSKKVKSSLPLRKFPALWNFEVDDDFVETPELMAQLEQAFVLSANEVHNGADIRFVSSFIKSSIHESLAAETVSNKKKKRTMMRMLDGQEDEDFEQEDYDEEDEAEDAAAANDYHTRGGNAGMLGKSVIRPSTKKFGPIFRPNYTNLNNVGCNLCSDDDDATATMLVNPLELGSAFYQLEDGREIRLAWQRKLCQKLRSIPELEKARRCFIYLDLDHEEPGDDDAESLAVASAI